MKEENEVENIRVAVRCRPMNEREIREQASSCFTSDSSGNAILTNLENPAEKYTFAYDFVYGCDSAQEQVFQDIGIPILDRAFGGYNGTIFAYGQTGSGKTFSMSGVRGSEQMEGLIPRMNKAIFQRVQAEKAANPNKLFLVECSFFEIYNEIIYDLLDASGNSKKNKGGLEIKEHAVLGIYVKDLQERVVESQEEVIDLMAQGALARTVGYTQMNAESSRSHSIFIIKIHQKDASDETKNVFAKINLVDLAGSERAASTGAQGDRLKEGANINKSLSALGNVINALVEASRTGKKTFIPYRNSKLTRVLQESLGGNSLCSMLATLSPANINFPETLSTLKYASRAKSIKVNAKKNEASSQISQLNDEIAALKKKLAEQTESTLGLDPKEKDEIVNKYEKQIQEMDRVRLQTWEDKAKLSKQHELERKRLAKEKALADQKIREERTRKWKLLEEKGDIELLMRALRDLAGPTTAASLNSVETAESSPEPLEPIEMKWLGTAQKIRTMETKAKDHRTLIMVFKDSLQKDVELWARRNPSCDESQSSTNLLVSGKRDDSAARHMTASQICSKLQNICQESEQLLTLENEMICVQNTLINDLTSELIHFKGYRKSLQLAKKAEPVDGAAANAASKSAQMSKEEQQLLEEREKGLTITLSMVRFQRSAIVNAIKSDRMRTFEFGEVVKQFDKHANYQVSALQGPNPPDNQASAQKQGENWKEAQSQLKGVFEAWEKAWSVTVPQERIEFVGSGDVSALGLESKLLPDECFVTSSKKQDAKHTRLNSPQFWIPEPSDKTPTLILDFELPRIFHSLSIRGGTLQDASSSSGLESARSSNGTRPQDNVSAAASAPASTFSIKSRESLQSELQKYTLDEISGDHDATYEILGNVMSWVDLLKTNVVPVKLFARPPVRFLHDVISMVIANTGYGAGLFTPAQMDYAQLVSKTDRADYLTKILDFVQEVYQTKHKASKSEGAGIVIAATSTNILAGKEPTDTLKFLCYFAIAAIEHCIENPPPEQPKMNTAQEPPTPALPSDESNSQPPNTATASTNPEEPPTEKEQEKPVPSACWTKKIRVSSSFTGGDQDWQLIGDLDANTNAESVANVTLFAGSNKLGQAGRYLKIVCVEWQLQPVFQVEVFGQAALETDTLTKSMEQLAGKATALLQQLLRASMLVLEEAKASWDRAKVVEREKQQELSNRVEEIAKLKTDIAQWEKQVGELRDLNTQLSSKVEQSNKEIGDVKSQSAKVQSELQRALEEGGQARQQGKALEGKVNELEHQVQTVSLQSSEQKRAMEALEQSKKDLEALCNNLREQLQGKEQQDGHQESKIASMNGELMAANVQIGDFKRKVEAADQMRKEQEAFGKQLHEQLQQARAAMAEKEQQLNEQLRQRQQEAMEQTHALQKDVDHLKKAVEASAVVEKTLKANAGQLEKKVSELEQSVELWQQKAADAERQAAILAETAPSAANAVTATPNDPTIQGNRGSVETMSQANDALLLEAQTKELRYLAEIEQMEGKIQTLETWQKEAETARLESEQERASLQLRIAELEEGEEELQLQLQVVTDERDSARQKEEQLFTEAIEKDQEIERVRDGYGKVLLSWLMRELEWSDCCMIGAVWVTDRMNSKEDELTELQEQLEKYQSLLQITSSPAPTSSPPLDANLKQLHAIVFGLEQHLHRFVRILVDDLTVVVL